MSINSHFWQMLFFSTSSCQKLNHFSAISVIFWIRVYVCEEVFKAGIPTADFLLEYTNSSLYQSDIKDFFCLLFKANSLTSYSWCFDHKEGGERDGEHAITCIQWSERTLMDNSKGPSKPGNHTSSSTTQKSGSGTPKVSLKQDRSKWNFRQWTTTVKQ